MHVLFHCRRQFSEVRTLKLLVKLVDVASSSGGSNRNMHSTGHLASSSALPVGSSSTVPVIAPEPDLVASPSFAVNLNCNCNALAGEAGPLGDGAFVAPSSPPCVLVFREVGAPDGVEDALQNDDDDDVEPATIAADDSKEETPRTTPLVGGGASSSGTNQYPPHFSTLDLDAMAPQEDPSVPVGFGARDSQNAGGVAEFQVGQQF
ncbi:Putative mutator sub-class protein [Arachis hypogaea]|nr:Putative mutator sub-class protein [Arachis hypogaea]